MTQLPLHSVFYTELLHSIHSESTPGQRVPIPAALPGEIASCERLVPLFGNDWFYGLQADGKRSFELESVWELVEWGKLDPPRPEDGYAGHAPDEATTEETIWDWADKACSFLWEEYLAPQLEPLVGGFEHVLGAAVSAQERISLAIVADPTALAAARVVPSILAFRIEGEREVNLEGPNGLLAKTVCKRQCGPKTCSCSDVDGRDVDLEAYRDAVRAATKKDPDFPKNLLAFVTNLRAMPAPPAEFEFTVFKADSGACGKRLFVAHTCFNRLDVAASCFYQPEVFQSVLEKTVKLGGDAGFGLT
jgi:hypothetical protein